jgi:PAS domain-containing protein
MDRIRSGAVHLLSLGIAAALLHLLFMRNRSHVAALEILATEQEQVIIERTRDLSQANEELERQLANRELAAAVFENAGEAIIITDDQGNFVEVNPAFSAMSGYAAEEVLGRPASILKSGRHAPEFYADMWHEVRHGRAGRAKSGTGARTARSSSSGFPLPVWPTPGRPRATLPR